MSLSDVPRRGSRSDSFGIPPPPTQNRRKSVEVPPPPQLPVEDPPLPPPPENYPIKKISASPLSVPPDRKDSLLPPTPNNLHASSSSPNLQANLAHSPTSHSHTNSFGTSPTSLVISSPSTGDFVKMSPHSPTPEPIRMSAFSVKETTTAKPQRVIPKVDLKRSFTDMTHQLPLVFKQVRAGVTLTRRIVNFFTKYANQILQHLDQIEKITSLEREGVFYQPSPASVGTGGGAPLGALGSQTYSDCADSPLWSSVTAMIADSIKKEKRFAEQVLIVVVQPLDNFTTIAETKCDELSKKEHGLSVAVSNRNAEAVKARRKCVKSWEELQSINDAQTEALKKNDKVEAMRLAKKRTTQKQLTRQVFAEFESLLAGFQEESRTYRNKHLPDILQCLEELEEQRLTMTTKHIDMFSKLQAAFMTPLPGLKPLLLNIEQFNLNEEISKVVSKWITIYGEPVPYVPHQLDLPCTAADLDTENWTKIKAKKGTVPNSILTSALTPPSNSSSPTEPGSPAVETKVVNHVPSGELWVRALRDYSGREKGELSFQEDDIIRVTNTTVSPGSSVMLPTGIEYWEGELLSGHWGEGEDPYCNIPPRLKGKFPSSVVEDVDLKRAKAAAKADAKEAEEEEEEEGGDLKDVKDKSGKDWSLTNKLRAKVSKKKRRFQKDGFDLDLSYIEDNIIAMGFPSEHLSGIYRNNMKDVQRFFNSRHPRHYKLYNLCSEAFYEATKFENRVVRFPFDDHNPCPFELIEPFCKDVHNWIDSDRDHLAAIHCKAGKGRTGMMIACFLLYKGHSSDADSALRYFAVKRTKNEAGVTIPSQIRYVHYWDNYLKLKKAGNKTLIPKTNRVTLRSLTIRGIPKALRAGAQKENPEISFQIENGKAGYNSRGVLQPEVRIAEDYILISASSSSGITTVDGDCKFTFYKHTGKLTNKEKMFSFWVYTPFLELKIPSNEMGINLRQKTVGEILGPGVRHVTLGKAYIDKACKDKSHKLYPENLQIELVFDCLEKTTIPPNTPGLSLLE